MKILIICGTNRKNSISSAVAEIYNHMLLEGGAEPEILNLSDLPADFIESALYENSGKNESFNAYRNKVLEFQKFVFIVPEYNGSIPGVLKAFIDGLKYPDSFRHKKSALVGLSAGMQGGVIALSHLSDILSYMGMNVLGNRIKLSQIEKNMKDGKMENTLYNDLLKKQVDELIHF